MDDQARILFLFDMLTQQQQFPEMESVKMGIILKCFQHLKPKLPN